MVAWKYLKDRGYHILETNYRCPLGEIDVIAYRDGRLAFVEVKTRRDHRFGRPEESVYESKQKRLVRIARYYMKKKKKENVPAAFDVLSITWEEGAEPRYRLIQHAFETGEG